MFVSGVGSAAGGAGSAGAGMVAAMTQGGGDGRKLPALLPIRRPCPKSDFYAPKTEFQPPGLRGSFCSFPGWRGQGPGIPLALSYFDSP